MRFLNRKTALFKDQASKPTEESLKYNNKAILENFRKNPEKWHMGGYGIDNIYLSRNINNQEQRFFYDDEELKETIIDINSKRYDDDLKKYMAAIERENNEDINR